MLKREVSIFLVVGTITVLLDFVIYRALVWSQFVGVNSAKGAGFLGGTCFAYVANRFWTFGNKPHEKGSILRFSMLYASTLLANIAINAIALKLTIGTFAPVYFAFILATGVSATLNFIGMKIFVFKSSDQLPDT